MSSFLQSGEEDAELRRDDNGNPSYLLTRLVRTMCTFHSTKTLGSPNVPFSDIIFNNGRRSSVVEQRFRKPQVKGSNPLAGSIF